MILTFEPFGFFSSSSLIVMYFPFAASSLAFAASEASNEATVTAWSSAPEARILPGTTYDVGFFCVSVDAAEV